MKYTKHVLPSGLRVVLVPMKNTQTAMSMVLVEAGSNYEEKKINGLSHFLEHMCFKGTENRTGDVWCPYTSFMGEHSACPEKGLGDVA